jgi:hypothetical protein
MVGVKLEDDPQPDVVVDDDMTDNDVDVDDADDSELGADAVYSGGSASSASSSSAAAAAARAATMDHTRPVRCTSPGPWSSRGQR